MRRLCLGLCLVVLLAGLLSGCGTQGGQATPPSTMDTPTQTHAAWVAAMQAGQRETLLQLAADQEFKQAFVDDSAKGVQSMLGDATGQNGAYQSMNVQPPTVQGAQARAISVWTFEKRTMCYITDMVAVDGVWKVLRWGATDNC